MDFGPMMSILTTSLTSPSGMPKRFPATSNNTIFARHGLPAIDLQKLHSFVVRAIKLLAQHREGLS